MDFYCSGVSLEIVYFWDGDNVIFYLIFLYGNQENFDCFRVWFYFERVWLVIDSLELVVKVIFMVAKCECNEYYVNCWWLDVVQSFENFELLVQNYVGIDFYQQIIDECLYFRVYVNC